MYQDRRENPIKTHLVTHFIYKQSANQHERKQHQKNFNEPNADYSERTNKEVLIHTWNQNNKDNQIKTQRYKTNNIWSAHF